MKTAVLAGLLAITAAAAMPAAPAQAATVKQVTSSCRSGDFGGTFTLRYETSGGSYHPIGAITTSGPYIGDSGTLSLRIYYRVGATTHTVYTRSTPTTGSTSETLPSGLDVPVTAHGSASATFDNGLTSCVATVPIS
ncbi:hypothetical protein [Amycolatopsis sp. cmx-4-68]|uniref:hypothetical protein n=1 Tax=Amycolatopsis sp. cmx-4-68 TaxID=2790938 RepID=UPI00397CB17B